MLHETLILSNFSDKELFPTLSHIEKENCNMKSIQASETSGGGGGSSITLISEKNTDQ